MNNLYATVTYAMLVTIVLIWVDVGYYSAQPPTAWTFVKKVYQLTS